MQESSYYKKITLKDGSQIALLGTAHISKTSADEVASAVATFEPSTICVELDEGRYQSIYNSDRWKNLDILQVLKQKKGFLLLANLVMASYQKRMSGLNESEAGLEMKTACNLAKNNNLELALCDREVSITLRRAWSFSSFWDKNKLMASLFLSIFEDKKISEEELAKMKEASQLSVMMDELAKEAPKIKTVLLDERDAYLAKKIYSAKGTKRLAVLGAAHLVGVERLLGELDKGLTIDEDLLCQVKKPTVIGKLLPYLIPAIIVAMLVYSFYTIGLKGFLSLFANWAIITSAFAGFGALLSLAHPMVILSTVIAAPFTTLNPVLGVGMVSGPLQAWLSKPRVADFESLLDDASNLKKYYSNRILHALNVFVLSSLLTSIGTFIAMGKLVDFLSRH